MTRRTTTREPLADADQVASYLGWTRDTLYVRRHRGTAPPAVRTGSRQLRWRWRDVDAWLSSQEAT